MNKRKGRNIWRVGFIGHFIGLIFSFGFGLFGVLIGGYVLGWAFRKGWDRGASSAITTSGEQGQLPR